jgi:hypothetical protein
MSITFSGISSNGCAHTFTITTCVTTASIIIACLEIPFRINLLEKRIAISENIRIMIVIFIIVGRIRKLGVKT